MAFDGSPTDSAATIANGSVQSLGGVPTNLPDYVIAELKRIKLQSREKPQTAQAWALLYYDMIMRTTPETLEAPLANARIGLPAVMTASQFLAAARPDDAANLNLEHSQAVA